MRFRQVISVFLLVLGIFVFSVGDVRAAIECHGSGTAIRVTADCVWGGTSWRCEEQSNDYTSDCGGSTCYRDAVDNDSYCGTCGGSCGVCYGTVSTTSTNCWTCDNACPTSYCGTATSDCGDSCACHECQTERTCGTTNWDCRSNTCNECETENTCGWTYWDCSSDTCNNCTFTGPNPATYCVGTNVPVHGVECNTDTTTPGTLVAPVTCTGTSIEFVETPQNTGTIWVRALGVGASATRVRFPTWSTVGGQDDIVWYDGVNLGGGTWQATINAATHAQGGFVNVNVYIDGCGTVNNQCFPNTGYTYDPKECSVTSNRSVIGIGNTFRVTTTGNAHINAGSDITRLWLSRTNYTPIGSYGTLVSPAVTQSFYDPYYIYAVGSANRTSTNAATTSVTTTMSIGSTGNYNLWCDLNADLNGNMVKCSGNPLCTFNGGSTTCTDWKNCSGTLNRTLGDNAFVCVDEAGACVPACGQTTNCGVCGHEDEQTPVTPTMVYPLGTSLSPTIISNTTTVNLRWQANTDGNTTGYSVWVNNAATGTRVATLYPVGAGTTGVSFTGVGGSTYYWSIAALNGTCSVYNGGSSISSLRSVNRYFRFNSSPTFNNSPPGANMTLANRLSTLVGMENTGIGLSGNQICDTRFLGNRIVRIGVTGTDPDGGADIRMVSVRMGGMTATVTNLDTTPVSSISGTGVGYSGTVTTSVSGNNRSVVFPIGFTSAYTDTALNILEVNVTDITGASSGWINSGRRLKVWDCQVPVSGTVYDSSAVGDGVCGTPSVGFNNPAPPELGFTALTFNDTPNKVMTVSPPSNYSSDANDLIWGSTYIPSLTIANGSNPVMRAIDLGVGTTTCYTPLNVGRTNPFVVNPYVNTPSLQVDFSSLRNQEPWFQVMGGGIKSSVSVADNVPITYYQTSPMTAAMTIINLEANNGMVAAPSIDNNSGCSDCSVGLPRNVYRESDLISDSYSYDYFWQEYFVKLGVGVTFTGDQILNNVLANVNVGSTGVVFIDGNLTVNANNVWNPANFLMVVVSGNITVAQNADLMSGIFIANGAFNTSPATANNVTLTINGLVSANGGVRLNRGFSDPSNNNLAPGVRIIYRPELLFTMPSQLTHATSDWKVTSN